MGEETMLYYPVKLLELCSDYNDLHEFVDRETRFQILRAGPKSAPQLIIKALTNVIMEDILGNALPTCSYPDKHRCNLEEIILSTRKVLSLNGIKDVNWTLPFIEAAVCKLMENNSKHVMKVNENIVVEYINRPPIKNYNPRSLLKKNFPMKRKYMKRF